MKTSSKILDLTAVEDIRSDHSIDLNQFREIEPEPAKLIVNLFEDLNLNGLRKLSVESAQALARQDGDLF